MQKFLLVITIICTCLYILPGSTFAQQKKEQPRFAEALITNIQENKTERIIKVTVSEGDLKSRTFTIELAKSRQDIPLKQGDAVLISYERTANGENVHLVDYVRRNSLLALFVVFVLFIFATARWKGLTSLIGMGFSFVIISGLIIPNILLGNDAIIVSLLGALFIAPISFYLAHGIQKKTTVALVGTFISLILTGILAYVFVELTRITGFAAEEVSFLTISETDVNVKSLLLAGIIIGALGVLDDITISQTAIVEQLSIANPRYGWKELYKHAMEVGRDHIASLVNTLILIYTGASLPLLLLFHNTNMSYLSVINQELIATEIIRTLVSSIGIVAAVPITTLIAAVVVRRKS
jgi:uncharacterized membrane protein